jgi:hypothetical protein
MTQEDANQLNKKQALANGDEYAFPGEGTNYYYPGMTKREYITIQLLKGTITNNSLDNDLMIKEAIRVTNELLLELNKTK